MKQILKKVSSVCAALVCAVALTTAGAVTVAADSEIDETIKSQIVMTAEGLTETIIPLSDEEIDAYMNSGDEFTENAISSWASSKEELGEFKETKDAEVTYANGEYTVTVPGEFEKADANFVYVFDENAIPTSMNVDVQYSMGVTLQRAGLNTLMGIGIVFLMLVFLSFVIYLFRFIPALLEGKKKGSEAAPEAPKAVPVPASAPVVEETADDTELIAVIAAAIAASEGTGADGFVVRSIRKVNRKRR
jgi:sodium pump decarboxylase gamma subunit